MAVRYLRRVILTVCLLAVAALALSISLAQASDEISALNRQVDQLYQTGRYAEAAQVARRALVLAERQFGSDHRHVAASLNKLASLLNALGRYEEAEPLYKRALAIHEEALGPEHPELGASLRNLAELYLVQRDWQRAADYWRRVTTLVARRARRGTHVIGKALTEKRESEAGSTTSVFWGLIKVAFRLASEEPSKETRLGQEMFRSAQRAQNPSAAISLAQMAAHGANGNAKLAALAQERRDLVAEWQSRDEARNADASQAPDTRDVKAKAADRARLARIDQRIAEIDGRLIADFPDYAVLANPEPSSIADVQAQLRDDEALVLLLDTPEWKPTPEETFVWVVTKRNMRWLRSALGTKELRNKIAALRRKLDPTAGGMRVAVPLLDGGGTDEPDAASSFDFALAYELYGALLAPAEDMIRDKPHLIVVPSGPLTALPFHVLVTERPSASGADALAKAQWLVRSHAITTLPSVANLTALRRKSGTEPAPKSFVAFANPVFRRPEIESPNNLKRENKPKRGFSSYFRGGAVDADALANLTPLPDTADEVRAIEATFGTGTALHIGRVASETVVKRLPLDQYRVVQFATHGLVAGEIEGLAEPALALTAPETPTDDDDGLLTASEIAGLKLNADWVLLSACNTAAGERPGAEALSGLTRAFFYAGTRTLLISHWPVYSDAALRLTSRAFAELRRSPAIGRSEALRRAMLALIDKGRPHEAHPSYWAPFMILGEGAKVLDTSSGKYVVQVAASKRKKDALTAIAKLQQKYTELLSGYRPIVQQADLGTKGTWYRLRVGPMSNKQKAANLCKRLKSAGLRRCLVLPQ